MRKFVIALFAFLCLQSFSYATTFPVDIRFCRLFGTTVGVTGWYSQERDYGFHRALDIPLRIGIAVRAAETGEIEISQEYPKYDSKIKRWRSGYGNFVKIKVYVMKQTKYGEKKVLKRIYVYGHLDRVGYVKDGDTVSEGDTIGYSGSTGVVDEFGKFQMAPHLHFEAQDPTGARINVTKEFGDLIKEYFNVEQKWSFTLLGGGNTNN